MTTNATDNTETVHRHGHCIVGCGHDGPDNGDPRHGDYCERLVGGKSNAVTEPGWERVQFWCTVIHPYVHGTVSQAHARDCDQYRDGVQLFAEIRDESSPDTFNWREVRYNLTTAEARQLAAQLVAAADSKDGINRAGWTR
jgi:hypothetical protein